MPAHPKQIEIATEDRPVLEKWANARATERRPGRSRPHRAVPAEPRPAKIAERVGLVPTEKTWRSRYERTASRAARSAQERRPLTHGPRSAPS